ncbi:PEP-CTERM sorting domain-containing protein [Duganella sp. FT109W]|uniref:PEP-CTERM sorting domain-containing protein n=1 Tax=Duganella margarita TaxID=2692170 RepID=A0ABW9WRC6_9BURK|nr:FxDxF family PEP-CTERM protein [Duganella margarita]MYN42827.1 PEP-CTERM sorting domain-containing protein [Duganella margarita]
MKKFTKVLLVASLLAGAGFSQSALAASKPIPVSSGNLAATSAPLATESDGNGGFNSSFGNTFAKYINGVSGATTLNKVFNDSYTFSVGGPSETSGTVSASYTTTQDVYISAFDIYTTAGVLAVHGTSELVSNGTSKNDFWSLPEGALLSAGSYYLKVTGQVLGTDGGYYGGGLSVTSAVPEAETTAMLLAGLGLVGFVGRRKAAKKAA